MFGLEEAARGQSLVAHQGFSSLREAAIRMFANRIIETFVEPFLQAQQAGTLDRLTC